jgi:hypothetical protein
MEFLAVEQAGIGLEGVVIRMDVHVSGDGAEAGAAQFGKIYEKVI